MDASFNTLAGLPLFSDVFYGNRDGVIIGNVDVRKNVDHCSLAVSVLNRAAGYTYTVFYKCRHERRFLASALAVNTIRKNDLSFSPPFRGEKDSLFLR